ncbi:MAG TPA: nuclear transport factor 2 family protein [Jiangellaceae bacterium]|nr:nuclear transport factor 2 family protein [Jiangellaceae bacterium]
MERDRVSEWVAAYERAWRTPGTEVLGAIFTESASYQQAPFARPVIGLPAISEMWEAERDGPDEAFEMTSSIVAVDDNTAVVRVEVIYGRRAEEEFRDLWIIRFAADGRCYSFEEWPFAPRKRATAPADGG